jgi:hypothetical protein
MTASAHLNPAQFREEMGPSPLSGYNTPYPVERLTVRHPDVVPGKHETYIAETKREVFKSPTTGRRLKNPQTVVTPGAGEHAAGFVDHDFAHGVLKIHYMKVAGAAEGQGVMHRAVESLISHYSPKVVDFGKLMNPAAGAIHEKVRDAHPDIVVRGSKYY